MKGEAGSTLNFTLWMISVLWALAIYKANMRPNYMEATYTPCMLAVIFIKLKTEEIARAILGRKFRHCT